MHVFNLVAYCVIVFHWECVDIDKIVIENFFSANIKYYKVKTYRTKNIKIYQSDCCSYCPVDIDFMHYGKNAIKYLVDNVCMYVSIGKTDGYAFEKKI